MQTRRFVFPLAALTLAATASGQAWSDDFESYASPSALEGQGGWKGWDNFNSPFTQVQSAVVHGGNNAISLTLFSDTVHEYNKTTGVWNYTGQVYVPTGFDGQFGFVIMNEYNDGGPHEWGSQVDFRGSGSSPANTVYCPNGNGNTPILFDQWVELRKRIDLANDTCDIWYGGVQIASYAYHTGNNGNQNHATLAIEAVDLFFHPLFGATPVYVDDLVLAEEGGVLGTNFECPATVANSSGGPATIVATGSDVVADNDVTLMASGMPTLNPTFGYFLNSMNQNQAGFTPPGSQGRLCIGPAAVGRYNASVFNASGTGEGSLALDLANTPTPTGPTAIQPGETWYFTAWFRDSNPMSTSNFTDSVCILFQ